MRLLVTRPKPDGARTAAALRARGHEVLLSPLLRLAALAAELHGGPWDGVILTSANAARALAINPRRAEVAALPAFVVGRSTAAAAREAGFTNVTSADGDARALVRLLRQRPPMRLLYLAGADQATDLAAALAGTRTTVDTVVVYRAAAEPSLPDDVRSAFAAQAVDGVLHFSARSAAAFVSALATDSLQGALALPQFCLSGAVAKPLAAAGASDLRIAPRPDEASLIGLVGEGDSRPLLQEGPANESRIAAAAGPRYAVSSAREKDAMASEGDKPREEREPETTDATPAEASTEETPVEQPAADASAPVTAADLAEQEAPRPAAIEDAEAAPPPPPPVARAPRRRSLFWPMIGSAVLGAVLALAALAFIWRFNVLEPYKIDVGGKLLSARLGALEARLRDEQQAAGTKYPAPPQVATVPPADTRALDQLNSRLARLEAEVQNPRPPAPDLALASRFTALESGTKQLSDALAAASKRFDELAKSVSDARANADASAKTLDGLVAAQRERSAIDKSDLDKLDARIAALDTSTKSLAASTAASGAAEKNADRNLRAAVIATALQSAVMRGAPYAGELAALKAQGVDAQALAPLEPFAATGAPTPAALARELADLLPAMRRAVEPPAAAQDTGLLARLQARANDFVKIRPVGDAGGTTSSDDAGAILARLADAASRQELAGVLADLEKLPAAARAPAQNFITKVQARAAAIAAAQRVAADALTALGRS
jgi:uroporphyrinogen-III synthase